MNRKKFIEQTTRGLLLGGMALVSLFFVKRSQLTLDSCDNSFLCKNCKRLDKCQLPEAKNIKK